MTGREEPHNSGDPGLWDTISLTQNAKLAPPSKAYNQASKAQNCFPICISKQISKILIGLQKYAAPPRKIISQGLAIYTPVMQEGGNYEP